MVGIIKKNRSSNHIIFRHGERTPIMFYPTDPYQNSSYWDGLGQLTKLRGEVNNVRYHAKGENK
ncbi:hypothetical protein NQ318_010661 [Aromia moschata]|uniref:Lysosomal acid phosphatase n=1 Tax=Aromia moschata TaxID=1265417 RepID=A0AAV8XSL2_9CUCU|nr:hypothetical protein NQ318_010661 [Aromia moschata]